MAVSPDDILFEFRQIGAYMKVTAMDPKTLTEISVQGPANAARHDLQRLAMQKLKRAIEQKKN